MSKYKYVLTLSVTEEARIVHFDNLAVIVTAKHLDDVEIYSTEVMGRVKCWLETALAIEQKRS